MSRQHERRSACSGIVDAVRDIAASWGSMLRPHRDRDIRKNKSVKSGIGRDPSPATFLDGTERSRLFDVFDTPEKRAAFADFFAREFLKRDHRSVFWGDRMLTLDKSMEFLNDPAFAAPWEKVRGAHKYDQYDNLQSIAWRMHTLVWAARNAMQLPRGDFVECGVFQGDMSYVVYHAAGIAGSGRRMHLFDSFEGIDPKRALPGESADQIEMANAFYRRPGLFQSVLDRFAPCPEVSVYKGYLPEALEGRTPDAIAWLHIDLNAARPEVETLERLFDRVVPSGVIVLDDYGWLVHKEQKHAEDAFFAERFYSVLELPTGQGLVVKRPAEIGRGSASTLCS
jgi:O-methyltransferase